MWKNERNGRWRCHSLNFFHFSKTILLNVRKFAVSGELLSPICLILNSRTFKLYRRTVSDRHRRSIWHRHHLARDWNGKLYRALFSFTFPTNLSSVDADGKQSEHIERHRHVAHVVVDFTIDGAKNPHPRTMNSASLLLITLSILSFCDYALKV